MLLVLFANLLVDLYARGAIRDALDEGVRAAAPAGTGPAECERRAHEVLAGLLRGPIGDDIDVTCSPEGTAIVGRRRRFAAVVAARARTRVGHLVRGTSCRHER